MKTSVPRHLAMFLVPILSFARLFLVWQTMRDDLQPTVLEFVCSRARI